MKKLFFAAFVLLGVTKSQAQIITPVQWSYAAKKISATEAVLFIKATVDEGWHIYSQTVKDGGPIKTTIKFTPSKDYVLNGETTEPKPVTRFEKSFNMNVSFFEHTVIFQQKVKLKAGQTTVKGQLEYMTCNDQKCLPPEEVDFSIAVK